MRQWELWQCAEALGVPEDSKPWLAGSRSLILPSDDKDKPAGGALSQSEVDARLAASLAAREEAGRRRAEQES